MFPSRVDRYGIACLRTVISDRKVDDEKRERLAYSYCRILELFRLSGHAFLEHVSAGRIIAKTGSIAVYSRRVFRGNSWSIKIASQSV